MTYQEKLEHPKWQKKRLEILKRDKYKCKKCGDEETRLDVHHLEYNGDPWEAENKHLVTVCKHCHVQVEIIKDKCDFKYIKILKSNNWTNGNRIMFAGFPGYLSMEIYDNKNNYIIGFEWECTDTLGLIKKLFSYVTRH